MSDTKDSGFMRNLSTMIRSWAGFRNLWNTGQKRDIEKEFGHPEVITSEDFWQKFDRGDIANRVVSIYPEECFKEPPQIYETEDADNNTEFEKAFNALDDDVHILSILKRADTLSGVGRYGVILLGLQDGKTLDQPVAGMPVDGAAGAQGQPGPVVQPSRNATPPPPADPPKQPTDAAGTPAPKKAMRLMYLRTFDESMVTIKSLEKDPQNPRFGQPLLYEITFFDDNTGVSVTSGTNTIFGPVPPASGMNKTPQASDMTVTRQNLTVHWHRIVHLADNRLRDEIFGVPRLKKCFDRILDAHKAVGASAEMFYKGANLGLALTANAPAPGEPNPVIDKEGTKQELEEYYEGLKRYLVLDGMDAKSLGTQVADPTSTVDIQLKLVCCSIGCPVRVFLGSEQAQLASGQDSKSWNERITNRRETYVSPYVVRPTVDRLIMLGVLPFPKGEAATAPPAVPGQAPRPNYIVYWTPINSSSLTEEADILVKRTQAMAQYVNSGLDQLMSPMMFLTNEMKYSQEEAQAIIDDVGDALIKTDPEAEHQAELDKIEAAAAGRGPGQPGAPGSPLPPGRGAPKQLPEPKLNGAPARS